MALFLEFSLLRRMIETKHKENLINHQVFFISKDGINEGTKHQQYCHLGFYIVYNGCASWFWRIFVMY